MFYQFLIITMNFNLHLKDEMINARAKSLHLDCVQIFLRGQIITLLASLLNVQPSSRKLLGRQKEMRKVVHELTQDKITVQSSCEFLILIKFS